MFFKFKVIKSYHRKAKKHLESFPLSPKLTTLKNKKCHLKVKNWLCICSDLFILKPFWKHLISFLLYLTTMIKSHMRKERESRKVFLFLFPIPKLERKTGKAIVSPLCHQQPQPWSGEEGDSGGSCPSSLRAWEASPPRAQGLPRVGDTFWCH